MTAKEELEKRYFNDHFFEEELNNQSRKIDFVAELMEDYLQDKLELLGITNTVGQSEQLPKNNKCIANPDEICDCDTVCIDVIT